MNCIVYMLSEREFCVSFSSFLIPKPAFEVPKNVCTPALFVVGENDAIVPPELTHRLSKQFCNARLEIHNGGKSIQSIDVYPYFLTRPSGHFVPRKPEWRTFLIGFFKAFAGDGDKAPHSGSASCLFAQSLRGDGGRFVPTTAGIAFPLLCSMEAESAKKKAREAITKSLGQRSFPILSGRTGLRAMSWMK